MGGKKRWQRRFSKVTLGERGAIARDYRDLAMGTRSLSRKYGYCSTHIYNILRGEGVRLRTRQELGQIYRKSRWGWKDFDASFAWAVGLLATDGHLEKRSKSRGATVSIATTDWELLEQLKTAVRRPDVVTRSTKQHTNQKRVRIVDTSLFEFLLEIGIPEGNKTLTLAELRVPNGVFVPFLCGAVDGDGHLAKGGRTFCITSASRKFLEWVKSEIDSHTGSSSCSVNGPHKDNTYVLYCFTWAARIIGEEVERGGYQLLDRKKWF